MDTIIIQDQNNDTCYYSTFVQNVDKDTMQAHMNGWVNFGMGSGIYSPT